jgi:hypothetical protein
MNAASMARLERLEQKTRRAGRVVLFLRNIAQRITARLSPDYVPPRASRDYITEVK